jgi:uncharacterized membrane protein
MKAEARTTRSVKIARGKVKPAPQAEAPLTESQAIHELTKKNIRGISESELAADNQRRTTDIIAEAITRFCGSATFVWLHVIWFALWILGNLILPHAWRWDPCPFPFLTLVVSLEAIFLSTFILIAENRQGLLAQRRAHLDLQINLLSEQENTKMLELLEQIAAKVGVQPKSDREMKAMQQTTDPDKVLKQIEQSEEAKKSP